VQADSLVWLAANVGVAGDGAEPLDVVGAALNCGEVPLGCAAVVDVDAVAVVDADWTTESKGATVMVPNHPLRACHPGCNL
jgi:hypothetical protein